MKFNLHQINGLFAKGSTYIHSSIRLEINEENIKLKLREL